jgi:exodeoxyribonuclease VII small subunit
MTKKKELSFAEARARLLEILHEVESDGGDVDQLASRLKEAAELHRFCNERLAAARAQVATVVADLAAAEQGLSHGSASSADAGSGDADAADDEDGDSDGADDGPIEISDEDEPADGDPPTRGVPGRLPF